MSPIQTLADQVVRHCIHILAAASTQPDFNKLDKHLVAQQRPYADRVAIAPARRVVCLNTEATNRRAPARLASHNRRDGSSKTNEK